MRSEISQLVPSSWNYAQVLRDDGLSYLASAEQFRFPPFVRTADEMTRRHRTGGGSPTKPRPSPWFGDRLPIDDAAEAKGEYFRHRATGVRQAVRERPFEGKLVPQDPDDTTAMTGTEPMNAREVVEWRSSLTLSGRYDGAAE